ncbi:MAG: PTS system mannose/fructose/sorbose family transporter subunit IID [Candidatus Adiutrix sp.]|nr:PTS system mannose/fructose/sorbose family transporter subunit IID [Candidatus Adiutrix sp.]
MLKPTTLAQVAWRSLFLEASWNNQSQQNLGLAAAVDPALQEIYPAAGDLQSARMRCFDFFNTNPILSGMAIGVLLKLEQDLAAGLMTADQRIRMANSLNRSLATLGDAFFWQSWLPLCCLITVWAVLSLETVWWLPLLLPVLFGLLAAPARFGGLYLSYRQGENIVNLLCRLKLPQAAQAIRKLTALLVGVSTVVLTHLSQREHHGGVPLGRLWLVIFLVAAGVILFRLPLLRNRQLDYWYPVILVALATAILCVWHHGLP